MTHNKQKDRTGGSLGIIPERRSDGVAGPSRLVPGGDASASGAANDCDVNNHEQDVEFIRTVQRLIERNESGAADAGPLKNPEPGVKIKNTAAHLIERDTSVAADAVPLNNPEPDVKIKDTASQLIERDMSGATDAGKENNHEQHKKTKNTSPLRVKQEASAPGAADVGHINTCEQDVKTRDTPPRLVERATGLRGRSICSVRVSKSTYRKQTERDLNFPDADVPYVKTEHAIRALVCSLMERQDRVTEAIFLKLNDLEYRVDDLELCKPSRVTKQPGIEKEARN